MRDYNSSVLNTDMNLILILYIHILYDMQIDNSVIRHEVIMQSEHNGVKTRFDILSLGILVLL